MRRGRGSLNHPTERNDFRAQPAAHPFAFKCTELTGWCLPCVRLISLGFEKLFLRSTSGMQKNSRGSKLRTISRGMKANNNLFFFA